MSTRPLQQNQFVKPVIQKQDYQVKYDTGQPRSISFYLYILFIVSYFTHLSGRIPALGAIRFDLLLMASIAIAITFIDKPNRKSAADKISVTIYCLILYFIITLPFVEYPGSVIKVNIFLFIKAVVFFFFTVNAIRTEKDLKILMLVFISCQSFRVFEPTWLHITTGYWGDRAHTGGGVFMDRLSGAPLDIINPNGLAAIIVSIMPFIYFLTIHASFKVKLLSYITLPVFMYALVLTESRSGMVGLGVVITGIIWKSNRKVVWIASTVIIAVIVFGSLDPLTQDRYLSIYKKDTRNAVTAQGRTDAWSSDLEVVWHRPIFGHGLGTSAEAKVHLGKNWQISHNLYLEVLQELGIAGFIIFMCFLKNLFTSFIDVKRDLFKSDGSSVYLRQMVHAMQVWMALMLVFSMASYGLMSYKWYLFGGLGVVIARMSEMEQKKVVADDNE